jgi:hypothetical protein
MHEMGLPSRRPYRKCARVVGEVCMKELMSWEIWRIYLAHVCTGLCVFACVVCRILCCTNTMLLFMLRSLVKNLGVTL